MTQQLEAFSTLSLSCPPKVLGLLFSTQEWHFFSSAKDPVMVPDLATGIDYRTRQGLSRSQLISWV